MRALNYFFTEAAASLWRGRRSAILAIITIAAGLFVLGFFLVVNGNLQQLAGRWSEAAELSVYLHDGVTERQLQTVRELVATSGLAASHSYVSKDDAMARFRQDFPDLASATAKLERNPFPASIEVRLRPEAQQTGEAVDRLAATIAGVPGVADVKYDRRWLNRLNSAVGLVRGVGLAIVAMLAFAAALTVANVVRLTAYARRDEIEIMQLVGAPLTFVRGPFVAEGVLQGGIGAILAILGLAGVFVIGRGRYGAAATEALGISTVSFLPAEIVILLVVGGMALGCLGGYIVARGVR
jgi:cell division transport system permease protein